MPYLESKSLEMITSTVSSAKGRNLHIAPKTDERSPNIEQDLIGKRSSLANYLATENNLILFTSLSHNLVYKDSVDVPCQGV